LSVKHFAIFVFLLIPKASACTATYVGVLGNDKSAIAMVQQASRIYFLRLGDRFCSGTIKSVKRGLITVQLGGQQTIEIRPTGAMSVSDHSKNSLQPTGIPTIDQLISEGQQAVESGEISAAELEQMVQEEKAAIKESQQLEDEFRSSRHLGP
jgi:hypothetical protein